METFLKDKKDKVENENENEMVADVDMMMAAAGRDSDEEMQSVASSGDKRPKPRLGGKMMTGRRWALVLMRACTLQWQRPPSRTHAVTHAPMSPRVSPSPAPLPNLCATANTAMTVTT